MAHRVIGTSPARPDAWEKVRGRPIYAGDLALSGMLHGGIVRSPYASAVPGVGWFAETSRSMAAGTYGLRLVIGAVAAAVIMGGCAMLTDSANKVGRVPVHPTGFREVQLSGTTLQIRYKTVKWVEQSDSQAMRREEMPDRWTSVPLESLPWVALDRVSSDPPDQWVPRDCTENLSTPDPAPAMTLHAYNPPFKSWYSSDAPGYEAPIAAYVDQRAHRLVLVRVSSGDGQRAVTELRAQRSCDDDQPWGPYARAALLPFAVLGDIITGPIQLIIAAVYIIYRW